MEDQEDHLIWKDKSSSLEIRFRVELDDGRPAFSELLAAGSRIHVQQMLPDGWGISITAVGKEFFLAFTVEDDGRLWVRVSDMDDDSVWWNGDNRPKPLPWEEWLTWAGAQVAWWLTEIPKREQPTRLEI
jgi:hypothetical protein